MTDKCFYCEKEIDTYTYEDQNFTDKYCEHVDGSFSKNIVHVDCHIKMIDDKIPSYYGSGEAIDLIHHKLDHLYQDTYKMRDHLAMQIHKSTLQGLLLDRLMNKRPNTDKWYKRLIKMVV